MSKPDTQRPDDPQGESAEQRVRSIPTARPDVDREFHHRVASSEAIAVEESLQKPAWADSTEVLVEALKRGDQKAWTHLDQTYRTAMELLIRRRLPGSMQQRLAPEDVFQSAMLRAYDKIESFEYRGKGSLRAWLARLILRRLQTKFKESHAQRCDVGREAEFPTDVIDMKAATPEDALIAFRLADVMMAYQQLDPEDQAVLTWFVQEKKKSAEIADLLGVSERTARRRISAAIGQLARLLGE